VRTSNLAQNYRTTRTGALEDGSNPEVGEEEDGEVDGDADMEEESPEDGDDPEGDADDLDLGAEAG